MQYSAKLQKFKGKQALFILDDDLNTERLETMYGDNTNDVEATITFSDPRLMKPSQRGLFYALLSDIFIALGTPTDFSEEFFKAKYKIVTYGEKISLSDGGGATVSQATLLIQIVIDFMFEWNVPFKEGFKRLQRNDEYYLYKCCVHRKCAICGKPADIHHATNLVGMGRNRKQHTHEDSTFIALCREHHTEAHNLGLRSFENKYHLIAIKLSDETLIKLGMKKKKG